MQIHELNNYNGSIGDAYLVVDNGSDTGKLQTTAIINPLNERIDNIIAGPAPSAAEIIDARLGADGVTYPSLGDAIRNQFVELNEEVGDIVDDYYREASTEEQIPLIPLSGSALYTSWANNSSNIVSISSSDTVKYNGYEAITVEPGEKYNLYARSGTDNYYRVWFVVDDSYRVVSMADRGTDSIYHDYEITIPDNGKYLLINDYNVIRATLTKVIHIVAKADDFIQSGNITIADTSIFSSFDDLPINKIVNILPSARLANRPDGFKYVGHNSDDTQTYYATVTTYTATDDDSLVVQKCTYFRDTYEFTPQPRNATRYKVNGIWTDWSIVSNDSFLHSSNRVVDVNSYEVWTFGDFNDAPVNSIYQVDLNCGNVVLNNPSPGNSGLLITYAFSPISRHALIQQHYALENGEISMYIRYSFKNNVDDFRWTRWRKVAFED